MSEAHFQEGRRDLPGTLQIKSGGHRQTALSSVTDSNTVLQSMVITIKLVGE